jgi:hypothetical protein
VVSSDKGSVAILSALFTFSSGMPSFLASSLGVGSRPISLMIRRHARTIWLIDLERGSYVGKAPEAVEDIKKLKPNVRSAVPDCTGNAFETRAWEDEPQPDQAVTRLHATSISASDRRGSLILRYIGLGRRGAGDRSEIVGGVMARRIRKSCVKEVPLSEIKDDLSRYLCEAETQEIVITRHGKPRGP